MRLEKIDLYVTTFIQHRDLLVVLFYALSRNNIVNLK